MRISPIDIAHRTFGKKFSGYDPDEVSDFLQGVADEFEGIIKERNSLKENLREKELNLIELKERDQILQDTITTAHKMAENIRTDAQREAKLILNDAEFKSDVITRDARDSLKKVYQEIMDLKRVKMAFETRLKSLVKSYLCILEDNRDVFPDIPTPGLKKKQIDRPSP